MTDTVVDPVGGSAQWAVSSLPGYANIGHINQNGRAFTIEPAAGSILAGVNTGPYASKDDAMVAIGSHTMGTCRDMNPG